MRKQSGFLDLLWQEGYRIYGIGGSDSHNLIEERYDGALEPSVAGDPGTYVFSKELTPTKLLQNLRKGHIYVSRYCTLEVEITADGETYLPGRTYSCWNKGSGAYTISGGHSWTGRVPGCICCDQPCQNGDGTYGDREGCL